MSKWKAIICTSLLIIAMSVVLTASYFVKSHYGFSLYQLIIGAIAYLWVGDHIEKFYNWLRKEK